jgi:hypothetical protein
MTLESCHQKKLVSFVITSEPKTRDLYGTEASNMNAVELIPQSPHLLSVHHLVHRH